MCIDDIRTRLSTHRPALLDLDNNRHAAVAMILRPGADGLDVLFIERSRNDTDPWSGQMAFPGGIVEAYDASAHSAAMRETLEEVGIDLTRAEFVGRLDDVPGRHRTHRAGIGIVVSGFVFYDDQCQNTVPNHEVAEIVQEPLATFMDDGRFTIVKHSSAPGERFPGVRVGRSGHQVVWGLTRRFITSFFELAGLPFLAEPASPQLTVKESN